MVEQGADRRRGPRGSAFLVVQDDLSSGLSVGGGDSRADALRRAGGLQVSLRDVDHAGEVCELVIGRPCWCQEGEQEAEGYPDHHQ